MVAPLEKAAAGPPEVRMDKAARRNLLRLVFREFHAELAAHESLLVLPAPRSIAARAERKAQIAAGIARLEQLLARTRDLEQ
jgi:hypothetical protein